MLAAYISRAEVYTEICRMLKLVEKLSDFELVCVQ